MAIESRTKSQNSLTVLVFKDNFASRTFQIPLKWVNQFGLVLGTLIGISILSLILATKFWRVSRQGDLGRVHELESELAEMKSSNEALEAKVAHAPVAAPVVAPVTLPTGAPITTPAAQLGSPAGAQSMASDQSQVPPPPTTSDTTTAAAPGALFAAFPGRISMLPKDAPVTIKMQSPQAVWHGKSLKVGFDIQYVGEEKGSQQGRILLLARGPEMILSHPNGVFNRVGSESLIAPDQGEYFSVSRFRTVSADFGPLLSTNAIQSVEVLILNQEGQVIVHENIKPQAPQK